MYQHFLLLLLPLLLAASSACSERDNKSAPKETPSDTKPVATSDEVPKNCPIRYEGTCYQTLNEAAKAAGKDPKTCYIGQTYPGTLVCAKGADAPTTGREPVRSADGTYENCTYLVEGLCYDKDVDACRAGGCALDACTILESDPAQVSCSADGEEAR